MQKHHHMTQVTNEIMRVQSKDVERPGSGFPSINASGSCVYGQCVCNAFYCNCSAHDEQAHTSRSIAQDVLGRERAWAYNADGIWEGNRTRLAEVDESSHIGGIQRAVIAPLHGL